MKRATMHMLCAMAALIGWNVDVLAVEKPRYLVLTDIGNEPDDQMSLVRLLSYSNEIDIEALVATTSTWQKAKVSPGVGGGQPLQLDLKVGETLVLDADGTRDPDKDDLSFNWFHYPEAGASEGVPLAAVEIVNATARRATVKALATCRPNWLNQARCETKGTAHVILAVSDSGTPRLTRYRRIVLTVLSADGRS